MLGIGEAARQRLEAPVVAGATRATERIREDLLRRTLGEARVRLDQASELARAETALRTDKVDNTALAGTLMDLAARFSGGERAPGKGSSKG